MRAAAKRFADLAQKFVTHHVVAHVDGGGVALRIGAAVALDHDAIEPEEHAAVGFARVHLVAQHLERRTRQQISDPGEPRAIDRAPEIVGELTGGALRGLQRDVAGKAFGDHHIDRALADVVAFDEAGIFEMVEWRFAQDFAGLAHRLESLDLFHADVEQAWGRARVVRQEAVRDLLLALAHAVEDHDCLPAACAIYHDEARPNPSSPGGDPHR